MAAWIERYHDSDWVHVYRTNEGHLCFCDKTEVVPKDLDMKGAELVGVATRRYEGGSLTVIDLAYQMPNALSRIPIKIL